MHLCTKHYGRTAIITRTRNRPVLLRRAIESVLAQSDPDWLHVIVNDGGNSAAVDILAAEFENAYQSRLLILHNTESRGMQNASNKAIKMSDSEFIAIHDDDDSWEPGFLAQCVGHLNQVHAESPVQGVVSGVHWVFEEIDASGKVVELRRQEFPVPPTIKLAEAAAENLFPPIAFLYRRRVHETVGYFDERFTVMGDWDFNLRFLCAFDIDVIPEKLARWHWRHQSDGPDYGNSCTATVDVHKKMEARMYNHYLRRDMENGHPGLGHLMNLARPIAQLSRQVAELKGQMGQATLTSASTLAHAEHLSRITRDLGRVWQVKEWLRRSAAIAREGLRKIHASNAGGSKPEIRLRKKIHEAIEGLAEEDVLSLDVFDTALLRLLRQPIDLFAIVEPEVRILTGLPALPFAQARLAAERVARQRHVRGDCEDVTFQQIYDTLGEMIGISTECAAKIADMELAAERRLCYANPVVLEASSVARERGVRTIFVSDMYLPAAFIRDLLEANGYEDFEIYVSCDEGKTKHSGKLFDVALRKLGGMPERWVHLGDHPESDYRRPMAQGIQALLVESGDYGPLPFSEPHAAFTGVDGSDALSSVCAGLVKRRSILGASDGNTGLRDHGKARLPGSPRSRQLWQSLGYDVAGPLMFAFAEWLARQALKHGVKRLFFLARDGFLVEKAFRACAQRWGLAIESTYMYSSRRLINMARMERMDEPALAYLLNADPFLRVRDFIERIGLKAEKYATVAAREGLTDLNEILTTSDGFFRTPERRRAMVRLFSRLEPDILDMAQAERRTLHNYFCDIGFAPGRMAVVDLGWHASSVLSLQDLLRQSASGYTLRGYYFGTWREASVSLEAGCQFDSFFFHLGLPERRSALTAECVELIEHLFSAPHATIVGLRRTKDDWQPVCGEWETSPEQRDQLHAVAGEAMAFVDDMLNIENAWRPRIPPMGYIESVLERLLRHPTRQEARTLGTLPHRDSSGGAAPWRYLAKPPSSMRAIFSASVLQEAYDRACWKQGFLAQLGDEERSLLQDHALRNPF
jgi:glycosyltransferase involved in cell wall biosynthesis/FMN phosphatase YigB (HAD superfamily)